MPGNTPLQIDAQGWGPWAVAALLGLGLAASCGLRAFLPLLVLAAAGKWHLFNVHLGPAFAWLESDAALAALAVATVVELLGDKIPAVDHALDAGGTVVRPLAGAVAAAAAISGQNWMSDPATAAIVGLAAGAPISFGLHATKSGTRGASTATTLGCANPVLSVLEDIVCFGVILVALALPLLIPLVLAMLTIAVYKAVQAVNQARRRSKTEPHLAA